MKKYEVGEVVTNYIDVMIEGIRQTILYSKDLVIKK